MPRTRLAISISACHVYDILGGYFKAQPPGIAFFTRGARSGADELDGVDEAVLIRVEQAEEGRRVLRRRDEGIGAVHLNLTHESTWILESKFRIARAGS